MTDATTKKEQGKATRWRGLVFAIQFLTIIPLPTHHRFNARTAQPFFPAAGLLIGALLILVDTVASQLWPRPVVAVLDTLLLAVISGALHLDGLADTFDGLYGPKNPERALRIMKDSRVGAMGVVAVVCCLAVKWVGLAHMPLQNSIWLLLVPAYARATVPVAAKALPYGRSSEGTAHAFFQTPMTLFDFWGFGLLLPLSLLAGWQALVLNLGFIATVGLTISWYRRKTGFITGDMFGAQIEICEAVLFLLAASVWGN